MSILGCVPILLVERFEFLQMFNVQEFKHTMTVHVRLSEVLLSSS